MQPILEYLKRRNKQAYVPEISTNVTIDEMQDILDERGYKNARTYNTGNIEEVIKLMKSDEYIVFARMGYKVMYCCRGNLIVKMTFANKYRLSDVSAFDKNNISATFKYWNLTKESMDDVSKRLFG